MLKEDREIDYTKIFYEKFITIEAKIQVLTANMEQVKSDIAVLRSLVEDNYKQLQENKFNVLKISSVLFFIGSAIAVLFGPLVNLLKGTLKP